VVCEVQRGCGVRMNVYPGRNRLSLVCGVCGIKTMSEYESINKLLNKAQRIIDQIAREIVRLKYMPEKENMKKTVDAVSLLNEVQKSIWKVEPDLSATSKLEDESNQESGYMKEYRAYLIKANHYEGINDYQNAILELQKALDMEPPHIMHEVVIRELERLRYISDK